MIGEAEDMPAEPLERAVTRGIRASALLMVGPVDFDHETRLRAGEVSARQSLEKGESDDETFFAAHAGPMALPDKVCLPSGSESCVGAGDGDDEA